MSAELKFSTPRFDVVAGDSNTDGSNIDDSTRQRAVLGWLAAQLGALGLVDEVVPKLAGASWYFYATVFAEPYRIQCPPAPVGTLPTGTQWTLSIAPQRSLIDRLLGRGEFTADNALVRIVLEWLEREADFADTSLTMR